MVRDHVTADIATIGAMSDMVREVIEKVDSLSVDELVRVRHVLSDLADAVKAAMSLSTSQLALVLEQPAQVGSVVYWRERDGKWRPDHNAIKARIEQASRYTDDGEIIDDPDLRVRRVVDLTYNLFVSPASMPKDSGMKQLHVARQDVAHWEATGYAIKSKDTSKDDGR